MNKVFLIGRLTRDPEVRTTNTGKVYARMSIAVDRPKTKDGQQQADFIGLVAWEKSAEFAEKFFHKGMRIAVEGRIQTGSYEKDGVKKYTTDVIVERFEFADGKGSGQVTPASEEEIPF